MQIAGPPRRSAEGDAQMKRVFGRRERTSGFGTRVAAPLTWTFDGPFPSSLADMEDTLRRAIVQVGDVSRVAC